MRCQAPFDDLTHTTMATRRKKSSKQRLATHLQYLKEVDGNSVFLVLSDLRQIQYRNLKDQQ